MKRNILLLVILLLVLTGCETPKGETFVNGTIETFTFESKSLEENMINESTIQKVKVYLPGSYNTSDKDYPVIYYLAGFGGSVDEFFNAAKSINHPEPNIIDTAIRYGTITECIVVGISGNNKLGGSFYVNSPVIGNWEDHILEIVDQVDNRYRTEAATKSRGLAGFSMGGFGSINVGLRNPDIFGYVYAFSPGVFGESGFDAEVWETWRYWNSVLYSYGAAFDPDPSLEASPYSSTPTPTLSTEEAVEGWTDSWSKGYGDVEGKIEYYKTKNVPLLGIKIDYAQNDYFSWLIEGSKHFYKKLDEAGVNVSQDEVAGYEHNIDSYIIKDYILSYFGSVFN